MTQKEQMALKNYNYMEKETGLTVRVCAKRRPSKNTRRASGTWVIREWSTEQQRWFVAGEVALGRLEKLMYLGVSYAN